MATNKTLQRLPKQGKLAGVCAGLADYFDFDVTIIRVIFVVLAFATGGAMFVVYLIMAIVMPVADAPSGAKSANADIVDKVHELGQDLRASNGVNRLRNFFGIGLLVLGVWLLLGEFFPDWMAFRWDFIWPAILIAVGIVIIAKRR